MNEQLQSVLNEKQAIQKKYDDLRDKKLSETVFNKSNYTTKWLYEAVAAMEYATPISCGIDIPEFISIASIDAFTQHHLTLNQVAVLCNNFQNHSARIYGQPKRIYLALLQENEAIAKQWNEVVKHIDKDLQERLEKDLNNLQKRMQDNNKMAAVPPPKAQA